MELFFGAMQGFHGQHQIGGLLLHFGSQVRFHIASPLRLGADVRFQIAHLSGISLCHLARILLLSGQLFLQSGDARTALFDIA